MLIKLAFIAILFMQLVSYANASDLDKYLDHLTDKKVDIIFVFDTSNSMGGEINELQAIANKFAADLEAYHIDYHLGLVEFRDFPITCGEVKKIQCGSPGDFAYRIKGNGTLTSDISTFGSWLEELEAGGGGSGGPEAVLAALRHAGSDFSWRKDAEKEIILLTDAGPHPDGSCCNSEGDTLEGTISGLTHLGASVNVIGPDDASLKKIADDTGGQFFRIRSGLSLKPLLEKITAAMSFSFKVEVEANCENKKLDAKVQLIGNEAIPYLSGQTEVWMFIEQAGNRSRYNLSYDQVAQAYQVKVPDVCGSIDLTAYGRVGEGSATKTIQAECGSCEDASEVPRSTAAPNNPPIIEDVTSDTISPQKAGIMINWTANASDPDSDPVFYRFLLDDKPMTDWMTEGAWTWKANEAGSHRIEVRVRDAEHAGPNGLDDSRAESFTITEVKATVQENQPPSIIDLVSAQEEEMAITWRASARDPDEGDQIFYKFLLNNNSVTDWTIWGNTWTMKLSEAATDNNTIEVQIMDGKHANPQNYDDAKSVQFELSSIRLKIQTWEKTFGGSGSELADGFFQTDSVLQTDDGGYIILGTTTSYGAGHSDFWLVKIDSSGNKEWDKTFGGPNYDVPDSVQQTNDGGFILIGDTDSYGAGSRDLWLIKTDPSGNKQWDKTFGGPDYDTADSVQQTNEGGYILIGSTSSYGAGDSDLWIVKTDPSGNKEWDKTFGSSDHDWGEYIQQTSDGGYILIGDTDSYGAESIEFNGGSDHDFLLVKFDPSGNKKWHKAFGGSGYDSVSVLRQTREGGYIVAGQTDSNNTGSRDIWLVKTDSLGNKEWDKTIGGPAYDSAVSIQQTSDGGYIVLGLTDSLVSRDIWLVKTDSLGNKEWDKTFGGSRTESACSVQQTNDGGYIILGDTNSHSAEQTDLLLIKTDAKGNIYNA